MTKTKKNIPKPTENQNKDTKALELIKKSIDEIRFALLTETLRVEQVRMTLLSAKPDEEKPEESIRSNHLLLFNLRDLLSVIMMLMNEGITEHRYLHNVLIRLKNSRLEQAIWHLIDDPDKPVGQDSDKNELPRHIKRNLEFFHEMLNRFLNNKDVTEDFIINALEFAETQK